jgi:flavin reductase (DIM6/NTAB) family NADH-FMN oxidoreductase RutF
MAETTHLALMTKGRFLMHFDLKKIDSHRVYGLFNGLIAPRPIALVTTRDVEGRLNAAPFSGFNYLTLDPAIVALGVANREGSEASPKDTARNIRTIREFVINIVTEDIAQEMNICAIDFPPEVNELEMAGLATEDSSLVSVPRIKEAHGALECREFMTMEIGHSRIILGEVLAVYVEDRFLDPRGHVDAEALHAIGRMNGLGNYVRTRGAFMSIPRIPYEDWQKSKGKG